MAHEVKVGNVYSLVPTSEPYSHFTVIKIQDGIAHTLRPFVGQALLAVQFEAHTYPLHKLGSSVYPLVYQSQTP